MRRFVTTVACLAIVLGAAHAAPGQAKPLKVLVFAGQSNMVGQGSTGGLPEEMKAPLPSVLVADTGQGKWVPFKPGKGMGPEIACCRLLAKALGQPVGFVKFAVGGTDLGKQWHPEGTGNLYTKLRDRVQAAQTLGDVEIVAMLWMQGERDSRSGPMAEKYAENLDKLVRRARADFKSPNMIFVCGRVNPPGGHYPHQDKVRKAQESISLPRTGWIDCDDLAKHGDNLHYNTVGLIEMGKRFAAKVLQISTADATMAKPASSARPAKRIPWPLKK